MKVYMGLTVEPTQGGVRVCFFGHEIAFFGCDDPEFELTLGAMVKNPPSASVRVSVEAEAAK